MAPRNGADLATAETVGEARKVSTDKLPSKPSSCYRQAVCAECGEAFATKRNGRKRQFCSTRCRDAHRRQLNFEVFGSTRYRSQAKPRNAKNPPAVSMTCGADFADRGSGICGPRSVIEAEIGAALTWVETVSGGGVVSLAAQLHRPALRKPAP